MPCLIELIKPHMILALGGVPAPPARTPPACAPLYILTEQEQEFKVRILS